MNQIFFQNEYVVVTPWKIIGLVGALMFGTRWLVQLYYTAKAGRPVTPKLFWIMSIVGSLMTLSYFMFSPKRDMVGIVQNLIPSFVAAYNLYLEITLERKARAAQKAASPPPPSLTVATETSRQ